MRTSATGAMLTHTILVLISLLVTVDSGRWTRDLDEAFYGKPFFGDTETEVIVQEGSHAFFHCVVHNLRNQTVSWIRNADSHILTIGTIRFVHDDRYELIPSRHGKWTLKLKYVSAHDAGKFECQVSTVPKLSQTYSLKVVVPSVKIIGDQEMYVKAGTAVTLRCLISNCLDEPSYIFWHHRDTRLLDADPGVSIATQRLVGDGTAVSTVTIHNPEPRHSGRYSCRPANLDPAMVNLHVIQEEQPAAMQHEKNNVAKITSPTSSGARGVSSGARGLFPTLSILWAIFVIVCCQ